MLGHRACIANPYITSIIITKGGVTTKQLQIAVLVGVMLLLTPGIQSMAQAGDKDRHREGPLKADLTGYEEVPAVSSTGSGKFRAKVSTDETSFTYQLSYTNLEGDVSQSHIHFGQTGVNGGISIWLCQTAASPSPVATTPACANPLNPLDTHSGVVTGTITAADVIGPSGQGIAAGEFAAVLDAMQNHVTYANVHSSLFPDGEIRGQIK